MASYEISLHPLEKIYIKNDTTTKVCYVDDESSLMIIVDDLDKMMATKMVVVVTITMMVVAGLHNLCHPTIRDGSRWSKFGARGEHGDVFLFSKLGNLSKTF